MRYLVYEKGVRVVGVDGAKVRDEFVRRYRSGESIRILAASAGRSYGFVHRLLTEDGCASGHAVPPPGMRGADLPGERDEVRAVTGDALREHARRVLAVHVNRAGRCGGCLDSWSRVAGFPCGHARYARLMLADLPVNGSRSFG